MIKINTKPIFDYMEKNNLTKEEFCKLSEIHPETFHKITHKYGKYTRLQTYQKTFQNHWMSNFRILQRIDFSIPDKKKADNLVLCFFNFFISMQCPKFFILFNEWFFQPNQCYSIEDIHHTNKTNCKFQKQCSATSQVVKNSRKQNHDCWKHSASPQKELCNCSMFQNVRVQWKLSHNTRPSWIWYWHQNDIQNWIDRIENNDSNSVGCTKDCNNCTGNQSNGWHNETCCSLLSIIF